MAVMTAPRDEAGEGSWLPTAGLVLCGTLLMGLGTTWDLSWHVRVGRDAFWIPPHVVIYTGTGLILAGLVGAFVGQWRRSPQGARGLPGLRVPRGLWIAAGGTVWFLASAPFDDLWHRLFGLDVTLWSPPHLSLIAAAWTIIFGTLLMLAETRRAGRRPRLTWALTVLALGFLVQPATLAVMPGVRYSYLQPGALGIWLLPVLLAALLPGVLFLAPAALRLPAGLSVPVLVQLLLRPLGIAFVAAGYALVLPAELRPVSSLTAARTETLMRVMGVVHLLVLPPAVLTDALLLLLRGRRGAWLVSAALFGVVVGVEGAIGPRLFGLGTPAVGAVGRALVVLGPLAIASAAAGRVLARVFPR